VDSGLPVLGVDVAFEARDLGVAGVGRQCRHEDTILSDGA
jgi:hypothetical protein